MKPRNIPELKPLFLERMQKLLLDKKDFREYLDILKVDPVRSIRCNTLKISPSELKKRLEEKNWKIKQPWKKFPEVMIVENELSPGELGRSLEHLLGYYYIQELASMLPILVLNPMEGESFLDLCAAPGSKTTQVSAMMKNSGSIIANEVNMGRLRILASNLERCGASNVIITKKDGVALCDRLKKYNNYKFDKILVDAPCSGEGTLRSSYKTYGMWNIKTIKSLPKIQFGLFKSAFEVLKVGGEIVYSTCTHAPEENEGVVNRILKEFGDRIKILKVELPFKAREGITDWASDFASNKSAIATNEKNNERGRELEEKFDEKVKLCARVYPHDNNTEGFFISKFRKIKD